MEQNEDVLAANEAFYDAFAAGDMEAMSARLPRPMRTR